MHLCWRLPRSSYLNFCTEWSTHRNLPVEERWLVTSITACLPFTRLTYFEKNPERNQKTLLLNCHTMTQSAGISKIFLKICFKFFYFTYFNSKVIIVSVSFVYRLYTGLKSRTATIILGAIFCPLRTWTVFHFNSWCRLAILQKLVL